MGYFATLPDQFKWGIFARQYKEIFSLSDVHRTGLSLFMGKIGPCDP